MKRRIVFTSVVTIVLCLCILTGSTFALFTSEDKVNIAVTAGVVNLTATIDDKSIDYFTVRTINNTDTTTYHSTTNFENGGIAELQSGTLSIQRMTPGDKLDFTINLTNNSNVDIKYCVVWTFNDSAAGINNSKGKNLHEVIDVIGEKSWTDWKANESKNKTTEVIIHLPDEVGNDYQQAGASINFVVYAIQGNANQSDLNGIVVDDFNN